MNHAADVGPLAHGGTPGTPSGEDVAAKGVVVAAMTLLSRISGLVRDVVLSHVLGASAGADTFFLAFRIPNFFRRLFAEGAFAQAFVPVLADYRRRGDEAALREFVSAMAGNLGVALLAATVLGVAGASGLAALFMWGLRDDAAQFALGVDLVRIVFPYLALISLTAFAAAVLNAASRYAVPAFTPVLLNLALILAALWAAQAATGTDAYAAYALAWGVLAAGVAQLLFNLPPLKRLGLLAMPRPRWHHPGVRQVGALLLPAVFGASAGQVNALVGTILASHLGTGGVAWLYYADRLLELPIGIVAIALGTVLLPNLSRLHSAGDAAAFGATLDWGMRVGLLLAVPAAAALATLALPLVATLFLHGEMLPRDAEMTAAALIAFAVGLVPLALVKIAAPGYFARQDTATPFKFALASVAMNIAASLAMFTWLGHVALALATSIAAFLNAGLLIGGLLRQGHYRPGRELVRAGVAAAVGSAAMCAVLLAAMPPAGWWLAAAPLDRIAALALAVAAGGAAYVLTAFACGIRPRHLRQRA